MNRLITIVRREYLERVRSKAFMVSTFLGPVLVAGFMLGPSLLMERQRGQALRIAVVDATGTLGGGVEQELRQQRVAGNPRFAVTAVEGGDAEAARQAARSRVVDGRLDGYLYLGPDALATSKAEYFGKNVSNVMDLRLVEESAENALMQHRLAQEGLDGARVKAVTRKLDLRTVRLTASGEREDRGASFLLALLLLTLLYMTVPMWGAAIMNGVIEEKSNRVVEVIVSSIPTSYLFAGKLLGVGGAGLTQVLVWVLTMAGFGAYLRRGGVGREHPAGGAEPRLPGDDAAGARIRVLPRRPGEPGQPVLGHAVPHPLLHPDADVPAHHRGDAPGLADRALAGVDDDDGGRHDVGGLPRLPGGHPHVRQAADVPRDAEVDPGIRKLDKHHFA